MEIWLGRKLPPALQGSAVTVGNFDGVHLGHLHILERLRDEARSRKLRSVAVIFEPQPLEFFGRRQGSPAPLRLTPLRDKLALLRQSGCLDAVWVQRFNPEFAGRSAEDFIRSVLLAGLDTRYLLIGDDFRFGHRRSGDFALLQQQENFVTERTPSILVAGERASSTAVRQALQAGRLDTARSILGHDYRLSGHVKHGAKLGRTFGVPTANIQRPPHRYALSGVFAVRAEGSFGRRDGVASFGLNPTVSDTPESKLEVHLFNFSGCLYGQRLHITFLHKLRDEAKFAGLDELKAQIHADISAAKCWLAASAA